MSQIKVTFPDGAAKSFASGISVLEVAKSISERLAKVALVAEIDGQLVDLSINLEKDSSINEEINKLRIKTTASLISRRDIIIIDWISSHIISVLHNVLQYTKMYRNQKYILLKVKISK